MTLPDNQTDAATRADGQGEDENALCKKTLDGLKEIVSDLGATFFPRLLEIFRQDAIEHLAALRSSIASGETTQLSREAHALKGASLTIGAKGMAVICKQLENLGTSQSLERALAALTRLDREFDRVKIEIEHESVIPRVLPGMLREMDEQQFGC
jgi:two-component system, sensor histidine kinase and response regulator